MVAPTDTQRLQAAGQPPAHGADLRSSKRFPFEYNRAGVTHPFEAIIAQGYQVHRSPLSSMVKIPGVKIWPGFYMDL
jgi:hypothetical protein